MRTRIIAATLSAAVLFGGCGSGTATVEAPATQSIHLINAGEANQLLADNSGASGAALDLHEQRQHGRGEGEAAEDQRRRPTRLGPLDDAEHQRRDAERGRGRAGHVELPGALPPGRDAA